METRLRLDIKTSPHKEAPRLGDGTVLLAVPTSQGIALCLDQYLLFFLDLLSEVERHAENLRNDVGGCETQPLGQTNVGHTL